MEENSKGVHFHKEYLQTYVAQGNAVTIKLEILGLIFLKPSESLPVINITFCITGGGVGPSEYAKFAGESSLDIFNVSDITNVDWTP